MGAERRGADGPGWLEKVLVAFVLFALTKPFFWRGEGSGSGGLAEHEVNGKVYFALVYGITLALLVRGGKASWRTAKSDLLLLGLVALAPLSTLWSLDAYMSARTGMYLLLGSLVGVLLATRFSMREQVELVAGALGVVAVLTLLISLAMPSYGLQESNWRGMFIHKNHLGRWMALGTVACGLLATRPGPWRAWALGGATLAGALTVLSGSSTAVIVVLGVGLLALLYSVLRAHVHLAIAVSSLVLLAASAAVVLFVSMPDVVFGALGRDATLTGRTGLWAAVMALILMRPWLGYGYEAFWWGVESSEDVKEVAGWVSNSAHNGFLELGLGIGLLGVALFSVGLLLSFARAFRELRRTPGIEGLWPTVFLSFFLFYNLTETSVLLPNNLLWALYVGTTLSLRQNTTYRAQEPEKTGRPGRGVPRREAMLEGSSAPDARREAAVGGVG